MKQSTNGRKPSPCNPEETCPSQGSGRMERGKGGEYKPVGEISGNKPLGYFISSPEAIKTTREFMEKKFCYQGKLDINGTAYVDCFILNTINQKSVILKLMIDTGAFSILLNNKKIESLGLESSMPEVIVGEGLNNFQMKGVPYSVLFCIKGTTKDLGCGANVYASDTMTYCDGIIGTHFFIASKLIVEFDYVNSSFIIKENG